MLLVFYDNTFTENRREGVIKRRHIMQISHFHYNELNGLGWENKRPFNSSTHRSGTKVDAYLSLIFKGLNLNMVTLSYTRILNSVAFLLSMVLRHSQTLNISRDKFTKVLINTRRLNWKWNGCRFMLPRFTHHKRRLGCVLFGEPTIPFKSSSPKFDYRKLSVYIFSIYFAFLLPHLVIIYTVPCMF